MQIVIPPKHDAADPVYAVNKNDLSFHKILTALQNSKQNLCANFTAVVFPAPALPVRNMTIVLGLQDLSIA